MKNVIYLLLFIGCVGPSPDEEKLDIEFSIKGNYRIDSILTIYKDLIIDEYSYHSKYYIITVKNNMIK